LFLAAVRAPPPLAPLSRHFPLTQPKFFVFPTVFSFPLPTFFDSAVMLPPPLCSPALFRLPMFSFAPFSFIPIQKSSFPHPTTKKVLARFVLRSDPFRRCHRAPFLAFVVSFFLLRFWVMSSGWPVPRNFFSRISLCATRFRNAWPCVPVESGRRVRETFSRLLLPDPTASEPNG